MCKFIKKAMDISRNLNLYEIAYFKIYMVTVSILISIWFPIVLSLNLYFYILLFIVLDIFSIYFLIQKEWNFLKKILKLGNSYKIFKNYWIFDLGLFKTTLVSFGLLISKIFPILLTVNTWIYLAIFWFWAWYFMSNIYVSKISKKNK